MSGADAVESSSAAALRTGSTSFAAAARLFDRQTRRDAQLLYAWCRHCDDVIDGQVLGHDTLESETSPEARLAELRMKTRAALAGERLDDHAFLAFQRVALAHRIPPRYPLDLLTGFQMDVENRHYRDLDDTLTYSYHVAGVVGLMMALIMGVRPEDEDTLDRACDLGLAFQLTNIARDVVEDAYRGRIYLPETWLSEAGLTRENLIHPELRPKLHEVAVRLLDVADIYYDSAGAGLSRLPVRAAMAIGSARSVYRGIGTKLRRLGPSAWDQRVTTSRRRKLALVAGGSFAALVPLKAKTAPGRSELWLRPGRGSPVT